MTETEYQVIIAFVRNGWSHRKIQEVILKIPAPERGGGFEAMKILHKYGIYGEHKSILKGRDVSKEILNSFFIQNGTEPKKVRIEIKKLRNN